MTTQEFVKKEAKIYWAISETKDPEENFADGLTKGLEIAERALAFARKNAEDGGDGCWEIWDDGGNGNCHSKTDTELLEIYLTENEKK